MNQERLTNISNLTLPQQVNNKLACGLDIAVQSPDYSPRSMSWNSNDYLANVDRTGVLSSAEK